MVRCTNKDVARSVLLLAMGSECAVELHSIVQSVFIKP